MSLMLEELKEIGADEKERRASCSHHINICTAAGCLSCGSDDIAEAMVKEVHARKMESQVQVHKVGCLGLCSAAPMVAVEPGEVLYGSCTPDDAGAILQSLDRRLATGEPFAQSRSFFKKQYPVVLENSGRIDPERIEEYIAAGGYEALYSALRTMSRTEVINQISLSGLRGRGGAGYPTGLKWTTVNKAENSVKYVVCNADEGDPGAFMDRSVLESDPHRILEGMAIAAYAVGAEAGFIYVRAEYPLAVARLKKALVQAERRGVLGKNIFHTDFSFDVQVRLGAGAFVCGEETALIASIEGMPGKPRPRPPYPAEKGINGRPTLINNVETFANIGPIIRRGSSWFSGIGTEKSKGTKVFALAGRVNRTGLIEVPMGTTLREIVFDIGGGIPNDGAFKAVQTGGPSGGCIPAKYLDMGVEYESLASIGSIMGSGGMIVLDQSSCMVDVAKFFMEFCMTESCGKCAPCRVGTAQIHSLLDKITAGRAVKEDLDVIETLCDLLKSTSLCGLGQTAANPVLSTLHHFQEEYRLHVEENKCPAGVCRMNRDWEEK